MMDANWQSIHTIFSNFFPISSYRALSYTDHASTRFLIGYKKSWDTRIYVMKILSCMHIFEDLARTLLKKKLHDFWATWIFPGPKKCAFQGLTVLQSIGGIFWIGFVTLSKKNTQCNLAGVTKPISKSQLNQSKKKKKNQWSI